MNKIRPIRVNMNDIELFLVKFGEMVKTDISHFKWCYRVQNGRFTPENQL